MFLVVYVCHSVYVGGGRWSLYRITGHQYISLSGMGHDPVLYLSRALSPLQNVQAKNVWKAGSWHSTGMPSSFNIQLAAKLTMLDYN